ncbi:DUF4124 domain-containing protein [Metapseudomonas resinovorans]|uniref:DUF4124 domain-containing protein n=1 Tax=Metapseudomonas resinovorans NBRC 106553 TaxID=1245471 RepID=S6AUV7_METRE|nr:DUF4124 domain-containing protein [Pseudomonas resinovorans]BAN49963.1 hypothetical protein PCA10_42310 [Pseudomonas resinovorans NBRC 106553]
MRRLSIILISTLPCCLGAPLQATPLYRCSDADGNLSFTQYGCPPGSLTEEQRIRAPNLLNSDAIREEAREEYFPIQEWDEPERERELVVVGEREAVCDNRISAQERRQAIIRKQVRSGMTRADVESALGKPDRVSGNNGQLRYHYGKKKGASHQVAFDEAGCVKGRR